MLEEIAADLEEEARRMDEDDKRWLAVTATPATEVKRGRRRLWETEGAA